MGGNKTYRINSVALKLGVTPATLRFWEKAFGIKVKRDKRGRLYTEDDIARFAEIKHLLYNEKYTIEGAKKLLRGHQKLVLSRYWLRGVIRELKEIKRLLSE